MVRIAVFGCGRIGQLLAGNIAAHPRAALARAAGGRRNSTPTISCDRRG